MSHGAGIASWRPLVLRDSGGAHRFGALNAEVFEVVDGAGQRLQGYLEPLNIYSVSGPAFSAEVPNLLQRVHAVGLVSDYEHAMGDSGPQDPGPWGNAWSYDQRGTRVADTLGRTGHVPQGWKVWDSLSQDYTLAIPMGPVISAGAAPTPCSTIPSPLESRRPSVTAARLRSVEPGTEDNDGCSLTKRLRSVVGGPGGGAGAGYIWDGFMGGLMATAFVNNCLDIYGYGKDGGPSGILSIRCDAHHDYGPDHGQIDFRPSLDVTTWPYPGGMPFKMFMAKDTTDPNRGSAIGGGNLQWVPWVRIPNMQAETPPPYEPPPTPPGAPPPGGGPPGTTTEPPILIDPLPPSTIGQGVTYYTPASGAVIYLSQPAYDRDISLETVDGLLYYGSGWLNTTTGRMVTQVAQFDGGVAAWGLTFPASNTQLGTSVEEDPALWWGSAGEDYRFGIQLDHTGSQVVSFEVRDSSGVLDGTSRPFVFRSKSAFEELATFSGGVLIAGANGGAQHTDAVEVDDGATVTLATIAVPTDASVTINAKVGMIRTDSGNEASEGAGFDRMAVYRNDAGSLTKVGTTEDQGTKRDDASLDADFAISGTDVVLQATGAAGKTFYANAYVTTSLVAVPG